jgi:glucosamine--fructose-6-phosphate aminotransferase (isomerizing)
MGGIVGYLGNREARNILVDCLGRLEDCGYDSAGMGTVAAGKLKTLRSLGGNAGTGFPPSLANLKATLKRSPLSGKVGVAHAYRSARGQVYNAHSQTDGNFIAIVHDGAGDNEHVVAGLLERDGTSLETLLPETVQQLRGDFALVGLSQHEPDRIVAARRGSKPLVIGHHYDGYFISSDLPAISHYTRAYQMLEDGEMAVISYGGVKICKFDGTPVQRPLAQHQDEAPAMLARSAVG